VRHARDLVDRQRVDPGPEEGGILPNALLDHRQLLVVGVARIVHEAAYAMATLIVAFGVEVRLAFLVELGSVVHRLVRVVDQAPHTVAALSPP